jgi:hypothetical protein
MTPKDFLYLNATGRQKIVFQQEIYRILGNKPNNSGPNIGKPDSCDQNADFETIPIIIC